MSVSSLISSTRAGLVSSVLTGAPASNGPGPQPEAEARPGPVGVALVLAEVQVDPAGELAAEDRVHDRQREVVGRVPGHADLADGQDRLRRAGLVDQVDRHRLRGRRLGGGPGDRRAGLPVLQGRLQDRDDRVGRGVADHDQGRVVGDEQRLVERDDVVAGQRLDRLRRVGPAVGVGLAVEQLGEDQAGDRRRAVGPPEQGGEPLDPEPLQLLLGERRGGAGRRCRCPGPWGAAGSGSSARGCTTRRRRSPLIEAPSSASSPASWSEVREVVPSVRRSPVSEASPSLPAGASVPPPLTTRFSADDRQVVPLGDQDFQAVGELPAHDRGRAERRVRAGLGLLGAVEGVLDRRGGHARQRGLGRAVDRGLLGPGGLRAGVHVEPDPVGDQVLVGHPLDVVGGDGVGVAELLLVGERVAVAGRCSG